MADNDSRVELATTSVRESAREREREKELTGSYGG